MRAFVQLLRQFRADERGVFGMIFGVLAVVLIALGGAVVDYVSLEQTRNRAQVALDAATLALQKNIFLTPLNKTTIRTQALALLVNQIGDPRVTVTLDQPTVDIPNGSLYLKAHISMPTIFVALVGVNSLSSEVVSEATRKRLQLEVVMVLDNSGSMLLNSPSRMEYLKKAANCATYTLFYDKVMDGKKSNGQPDEDTCVPATGAVKVADVKLGVVPFTMYVNVGTANKTQTWLDQNGLSPLSDDNFDNDDDDSNSMFDGKGGSVNRLALYAQLKNDAWRGCVEARPHASSGGKPTQFYDTDDTTPTAGNPSSLFVPLFAPDLAETTANTSYNNFAGDSPKSCDRPATGSASCTMHEKRTSCNSDMSNGSCSAAVADYAFTGPVKQTLTGGVYVGGYPPACDCRSWASDTGWTQTSGSNSNRTFERTRKCTGGYVPTGLSQREYQQRLCKYTAATLNMTTAQKGPNADCPYEPILPLTTSDTSVIATIGHMVADGGTNIHEGTAWGMRVLTPGLPFTEGAQPDEALQKVLIIMTDGENTAYHGESNSNGTTKYDAGTQERRMIDLNGSAYHSAYAFPYNARLGTLSSTNEQLVAEMNNRLAQTCVNANAAGIRVYTIGLATSQSVQSTQKVVEDMLTACATTPDRAHFPATPKELKDVFAQIADELAALRIAQ